MKNQQVGCKVCGKETPQSGAKGLYCSKLHRGQDTSRYSGETVKEALARIKAKKARLLKIKSGII